MTVPPAVDLRARRLPLPGPVAPEVVTAVTGRPDALHFAHRGRTLVGVGRAVVLEVRGGTADAAGLRATAAGLAHIPVEDLIAAPGHPGPAGPLPHPVVAFGALPFRPTEPAHLFVPRVLVGVEPDGRAWMTVVSDGDDLPDDGRAAAALLASLPRPLPARGPARGPSGGAAPTAVGTGGATDLDRATFIHAVERALAAIRQGRLHKVVLGRGAELHLGSALPVGELVHRWGTLEPACTTFALPVEVEGAAAIMIGASPELLVARHGAAVVTRPLAGTTGHDDGGDRPVAGGVPLSRSAKDGREHRLVVEAIAGTLGPRCRELAVPDRPGLLHLRSITHLATEITGQLRARHGSVPSALELAGLLHPTPAVGGVPTDTALDLISELETRPRGSFAGPVGYVDGAGDGTWVVGIRSLVCGVGPEAGRHLRLWAGVGIVDGSDASSEWAETELKLAAVVDAVREVAGVPEPAPLSAIR